MIDVTMDDAGDDSDPFRERADGPTPAGGAWSEAEYLDDAGLPARRSAATRMRITEYDADGSPIQVTTGTLGG